MEREEDQEEFFDNPPQALNPNSAYQLLHFHQQDLYDELHTYPARALFTTRQ